MATQTEPGDTDPQLLVSELFYSIQGESTYAGYPCVFIRLAGCNLRCTYCDARYSYEEASLSMSLVDLLSFTQRYPSAIIEITGGEPLRQEGVYRLMEKLLEAQRTVLLETNGSILLDRVPAGVITVMDMKCPDSGMSDKMNHDNLRLLSSSDELKFVISSRQDFDWAVQIIRNNFPVSAESEPQKPAILFSPVTPSLDPALLAQWILEHQLPVRLQLQLHTLLWPSVKRGV